MARIICKIHGKCSACEEELRHAIVHDIWESIRKWSNKTDSLSEVAFRLGCKVASHCPKCWNVEEKSNA